ncbi:MAG: DUF1674 domain-containing protein [Hyphomicrobiaceae bacterium]|nr:DUF1674 domain-containing protein [Hyphomicrobiaceae bacterium]MCC0024987.1 DUF1674 domain-containing protein [Hyphomicrobiaceae bacterium]
MNDTIPKARPNAEPKRLSNDAENALAEARARKAEIDAITEINKGEKNGRGGLDPSRYGDWEVKGITSDF